MSTSPDSLITPKLQDMEPLIIDANTGLGRFSDGLNSDLAPTEKTLRHLRAAGINKAIAYSVLSRQTDAKEGNAIILEEAKKHPELIASCVITPYEMPVDSVLDRMRRNNIRIARLFPKAGHFSVYPSIIGPIVEKLQNENKVLFIDFESLDWSGSAINYDAVYQLCRAYPKIPIVLVGSTILGSRNYPHMLEECNNLYLEISQILQPEGVVRLVQNGYGRRLIFGSGFPVREPGALLNMLAYSGLSPNELEDICSGNVLRLLNIKHGNDSFFLNVPESREIIDSHVHQGTFQSAIGAETTESTIRNMDRCGIKAAIVTSLWSCFGEVVRGNKSVSDGCAKYPGRYFGYLTVDPKHPEEVQSEINLHGDNPSFRGFKLHLELHGLNIDDPRNRIIYSYADKRGWPLLIHGDGNPTQWEKLCTTYENANFIKAHSGGSDPKFNESTYQFAELAKKCKNLYLDCAFSRIFPGALDRLTAIAGAEQILYGSDYPMYDFAFETGRVFSSNLSEKEKEMIFCGNAKKLFGL